jgi:hypothetical protein
MESAGCIFYPEDGVSRVIFYPEDGGIRMYVVP